MKLTVIGGGSPRTPLLIKALLKRKDLNLSKISLFDADLKKLKLIMRVIHKVIEYFHSPVDIKTEDSIEEALSDADYVFSSFRVGGDEGRIIDEAIPLKYGELGQETVGPGGFAMALRTIPVSKWYADLLSRISPNAWLINFTNPSGIITEALIKHSTHKRILGICDSPSIIQRMAAELYNVSYREVMVSYFGLNHLGWVYSLKVEGKEKIKEIISERLDKFVRSEPIYSKLMDHMRDTQLIPNEYLLYYLFKEETIRNILNSKKKRSEFIRDLNRNLLIELQNPVNNPVQCYNRYIEQRNGSYMAVETGVKREEPDFNIFNEEDECGYDKVAISVMEALAFNRTAWIPINIRNSVFCSFLSKDDCIEVSCRLDKNRIIPACKEPSYPAKIEELIRSVKRYENAVVTAAIERDRQAARKALALSPLIIPENSNKIFEDYLKYHAVYLRHLK